MPIPTLNTTVGSPSANSYVTIDEAEAFFDAQLNVLAWTGATSDDKTRALLMAAKRLEIENWLGNRVTTTQRLAWPRLDVAKVDPIGVGYSYGYGGGWGYGYGYGYGFRATEYYPTTEIPQRVKDAQCHLALGYLSGFDEGQADGIESFSADGVSVKYRSERPASGLPVTVEQLIAGLIQGGRLVRA